MKAEDYPDPLQYLSPIERLLVGSIVVRQFKTDRPRFAKWVERSGPRATVRFLCGRLVALYAWVFVFPGVIFQVAGLAVVADVLYAMAGVCIIWAIGCLFSGFRPQREFRRSRDAAKPM